MNSFITPELTGLFSQHLAFDVFKEEFLKLYPGSHCVAPNEITTFEARGDTSRFYPQHDEEGRVVSGHFG